MSFVDPRRSSARYGAGIVVAIVFNALLIWALLNGIGHRIMQVVSAPIQAKIVEENKPPPPPRVIEIPPPPKFLPVPAYVPPPEVRLQQPAPEKPAITATIAVSPPAPSAPARIEAPAPAAPSAPAPAVSAAVACSNYRSVMSDAGFPRAALRAGLDQGNALIQFTLTANGEIRDVKALKASHPTFAEGAMKIVTSYKCTGQGRDVIVRVPFVFNSE